MISPSLSVTIWTLARAISVRIEAGQPLGLHLALKLLLYLPFGLVAEVAGQHLARPVADAMGDIVARDVEDFPVLGDAPDDDMDMRMAGVDDLLKNATARRGKISPAGGGKGLPTHGQARVRGR